MVLIFHNSKLLCNINIRKSYIVPFDYRIQDESKVGKHGKKKGNFYCKKTRVTNNVIRCGDRVQKGLEVKGGHTEHIL